MADSKALFARRQRRARYALRKAANGRPRLSVFRSGKHIYAPVSYTHLTLPTIYSV